MATPNLQWPTFLGDPKNPSTQPHLPDVKHYRGRTSAVDSCQCGAVSGCSFSVAEVVVEAGNHGDRFLPAHAQGSNQPARARERKLDYFFGCSEAVICRTAHCYSSCCSSHPEAEPGLLQPDAHTLTLLLLTIIIYLGSWDTLSLLQERHGQNGIKSLNT